jgi:hypothetical protein
VRFKEPHDENGYTQEGEEENFGLNAKRGTNNSLFHEKILIIITKIVLGNISANKYL